MVLLRADCLNATIDGDFFWAPNSSTDPCCHISGESWRYGGPLRLVISAFSLSFGLTGEQVHLLDINLVGETEDAETVKF